MGVPSVGWAFLRKGGCNHLVDFILDFGARTNHRFGLIAVGRMTKPMLLNLRHNICSFPLDIQIGLLLLIP